VSGEWLDWLRTFASLMLMAGAIKLMDDYLDRDFDLGFGRRTLAARLERSALPYGLLLALVGSFLDLHAALAVFFGSYAVGMFSCWRTIMPTRLPAYVEIVATVGLSCLLLGWRTALWGLAMMAVIDWLDDLVDTSVDRRTGQGNLAVRIGVVETLLLMLATLCVAVVMDAHLTILAFIVLPVVSIVAEVTTIRLWQAQDEHGGESQ
jgi:1,4-dihydroxy-2-naphthoate octaprenyltransferase